MCGYCDILNIDKEVDPPTPFDENDFNRMSNDVWIGAINNQVLPEGIYLKTAKYLKEGIDLAPVVDEILTADLTNNIYIFSGAKTYQQTRAMTAMLADPELQSNFYKFKEAVKPMFNLYNQDYLQAEYQTAKASARMASDWKRIEADADVLPLLQYQTIGDGRVRPTHQALDNIIRPISDPFWKQYYPPNGWRCRCTVIQLSEGQETDLSKFTPPDDVPPLFRMNAGIDGYVFKEKGKDKHPYFDIAKGDKEMAKKNWNLPIPQAPRPAPSVKVPKVLTKAESDAVEWYVSGDGMWINQYLRDSSKFGELTKNEKTLLNSLTTATNKKLEAVGKVYRSIDASVLFKGITQSEFESIQSVLLYGDNSKNSISLYEKAISKKLNSFTEKGFMSTTKVFDIASDFKDFTGAKMPVIIDLNLGETAKGLDITKELPKLNKIMKQEEILLGRNQKIEIFDIKVVDGNIVINASIK
jgi:SPP1 gp7 family putative phage head morphogenesis protein